jgi:nucleotide-binding universal stress UspA family protein
MQVLVPCDGSAESAGWILGPVHRFLGGREGHVHLLRVIGPRAREDYGPLKEAREKLHAMVLNPEVENLRVSLWLEKSSDPAEGILSTIRRTEPNLVAMATHARTGVSRAVLGSVAETVLRGTTSPMLLCNEHGARMAGDQAPFRRILVPLDGSEVASAVVPHAQKLALAFEAEVVLLRIDPAFDDPGTKRYDELSGFLNTCASGLERMGVKKVTLVGSSGDPAQEILRTVEGQRVDLVAMSTHGRSGFDRLRFGSVAEEVLRHCPCPMLICRAPE